MIKFLRSLERSLLIKQPLDTSTLSVFNSMSFDILDAFAKSSLISILYINVHLTWIKAIAPSLELAKKSQVKISSREEVSCLKLL